MDRKYAMILGIGITLAVILGATGIGYAVYMGNTYSEHNTMDVVENSIDIYKDGDPIETPISMPEYRKGSTSYITGYRVATTGPGSFYLQCQMGDNAAWPLIESMSMTISDAGHPSAYPFGVITHSWSDFENHSRSRLGEPVGYPCRNSLIGKEMLPQILFRPDFLHRCLFCGCKIDFI